MNQQCAKTPYENVQIRRLRRALTFIVMIPLTTHGSLLGVFQQQIYPPVDHDKVENRQPAAPAVQGVL